MKEADDTYGNELVAWCRYHVVVETYDRNLTDVRSPLTGDAVISHDSDIAFKSRAFAREMYFKLIPQHSICTEYTKIRNRAKDEVSSWSYEQQKRYLARFSTQQA